MPRQFHIGCDIGGTFTDVCVRDNEGRSFADKAETTPGNLAGGMVQALENVAARVGVPLEELLAATTRFVNGTTIITNAIAELRGATVGLITTKGHGDVLRIARSARNHHRDHHLQRNIPQVVPRDLVVEVEERIDRNGRVVVPLREDAARAAIDALLARGVESIAISLLWSFANPAHEEQLAKIIEAEHPGLYISVASRLHPVIREYERTMTTVLNSFTGLRVTEYIAVIEEELFRRGLSAPISLMSGFGGTLSAAEAQAEPIALVDSGPAGGVVGAAQLGRRLGLAHVLAADMGGTSFDVTVIADGEIPVTQRAMLGERFLTGLSKIDVHPVGAGGGSIAWIDARGAPRVGPRSAGADPGPACYGQGGAEATVTDACVQLGLLDPDRFLGGRRRLDGVLASAALDAFGAPLRLDADSAAAAIHRLVVAEMSAAVRAVTVERGRDPRTFAMVAFGGALGVFAADIARQNGVRTVVVPADAAVFSASGLLGTDDLRTRARSAAWSGGHAGHLDDTFAALEQQAVTSLRRAGHPEDRIEVTRQGDFKFAGQLWELTVPIPSAGGRVTTADLEAARTEFPARYEAEYGAGTAWPVPVVLLAARLVARGVTEKFEPSHAPVAAAEPQRAGRRTRRILLPVSGEWVDATGWDASEVRPGATLVGPAVVDHPLTTVFVPSEWTLRVEENGHYVLEDQR